MLPLVFALFAACSGARDVPPESAPVPAPPPPAERPTPVDAPDPIAAERPRDPAGDPYSVAEGPTLTGTTLTLTARHGGGCAEHTFTLAPGPRKGGSLPLWLVHDAHDDRCRAIVTTEVSLSIERFLADGDCTEGITLHGWATDGETADWTLALDRPVGCD